MKTINNYKSILYIHEENTLLGAHLNSLFGEDIKTPADVHNLEDKIEILVFLYQHGLNIFTDAFQLGTITWAYYAYYAECNEKYKPTKS